MKREIYEVYAKVVDANGNYSTLSGYPKVFDSHLYNDDCEKAKKRAYGEYHTVLGTMCTRDDRQCQIAMILRGNDGLQIEKTVLGQVDELPDPVYVVAVTNGIGSGQYAANTRVSVNANNPADGYEFDAWTGADSLTFVVGNENTSGATFIMPPTSVSLTATYKEIVEPEET